MDELGVGQIHHLDRMQSIAQMGVLPTPCLFRKGRLIDAFWRQYTSPANAQSVQLLPNDEKEFAMNLRLIELCLELALMFLTTDLSTMKDWPIYQAIIWLWPIITQLYYSFF